MFVRGKYYFVKIAHLVRIFHKPWMNTSNSIYFELEQSPTFTGPKNKQHPMINHAFTIAELEKVNGFIFFLKNITATSFRENQIHIVISNMIWN